MGERVFTFNSKNTKWILGKKGTLNFEDQAWWRTSAKGLVNLVLSISFPDENDAVLAERTKQG